MAAMARHSDAAVPAVIAQEMTGIVLGAPFLLLERPYGTVPGDDPPFVTGGTHKSHPIRGNFGLSRQAGVAIPEDGLHPAPRGGRLHDLRPPEPPPQ